MLSRRSLMRAGLVSAAIVACGAHAPAWADDAPIRIGGNVNDPNVILPIQAAIKLGFFDRLGIKVELAGYSGSSVAMEALAAGAAEFAVFIPAGTSMALARGITAKIVSVGILSFPDWGIYAKKNSKIKSVKDLDGKTIGITSSGSSTDFLALWAAHHANITVTRVPVGGGGLVPNLLSGNVDSIVAFPPLGYTLDENQDIQKVYDFAGDLGKIIQSVWVASDKIIKENPQGVRKLLTGVYSAIAYMQKNPEWAYSLIQEAMQLEPDIAKKEFAGTIAVHSVTGVIDEAALAPSLEFLTLAGMKDMPSGKAIYTNEFVPVKLIEK